MSIENELHQRSGNQCELCASIENLSVYQVPPTANESVDGCILTCSTCLEQIENPDNINTNHWRCLNDSMWSEVNAVKVMVWRMLSSLKSEGWTQDLLDIMYLEEDVKSWAEATREEEDEKIIHKDSNGVTLNAGDSVVLIKDLQVKGSSLIAKRGTAVRRISLDYENEEYIEGKVDGQQIVIITQYVKKI